MAEFSLTLTIILALLLDKYLGEARRFHYLVGFGYFAKKVEAALNKPSVNNKLLGAFSWCLLVLPLPLCYFYFLNDFTWYWQILLDASVLYLAIGLNSLHQHAMQVYQPLTSGDLPTARQFTGYLVSRDTSELTPQEMSRATIESMLENGHDSVIASLFWYLIGGAPLVILHRLANTLDAMWGYKTARFINFGFASARLDDGLGFFSGKLCTLLYAVQGLKQKVVCKALTNAYRQGNQYKSHNGGWVMAAGATVMARTLGGSALYHGKVINSVVLGYGREVTLEDIPRSLTVVSRASAILVAVVIGYQLISFFS
ncbi:cobalamin biosynthesis protein CobD/CbiB [Colwellia echini]|uniref:Cobalamin biosynthesis protein CobD n=1 Tax=Colwellia echini TaxID=1982103 RepID=A0ABY3MXQ6_9GAMM|nr:CobD/CbiB family cobalamin biosynthesis protein [Colwellia echini]TYK65974.1 cobalamin biosynthesis protein [Colwellia echini]